MSATRPLPVPDEGSAPFWQAAARGELALPRCSVCSSATLPPDQTCPSCGTTAPDWSFERVGSRGSVRSWTVVRQAFLPGVEVPFVLVDVELADAPDVRLITRLVDGPDAPIALGAEVEATFEQVSSTIGIPAFGLVGKP